MEGRVRTDMSVIDLFLLSSHLSSDRRVELTEGPVLTASAVYLPVPGAGIAAFDKALTSAGASVQEVVTNVG